MNANATQVGGMHYKAPMQHWDLVATLGLGYFEGNITKYLTRHRKKNGWEDLSKAAHYLTKLQELADHGVPYVLKRDKGRVSYTAAKFLLDGYCAIHGLENQDIRDLMLILCTWRYEGQLEHAKQLMQKVLRAYATPPGA